MGGLSCQDVGHYHLLTGAQIIFFYCASLGLPQKMGYPFARVQLANY